MVVMMMALSENVSQRVSVISVGNSRGSRDPALEKHPGDKSLPKSVETTEPMLPLPLRKMVRRARRVGRKSGRKVGAETVGRAVCGIARRDFSLGGKCFHRLAMLRRSKRAHVLLFRHGLHVDGMTRASRAVRLKDGHITCRIVNTCK